MTFTALELEGAYLIECELHTDERGFFARTFCEEEFAARGLDPHIAQCSISFNSVSGTLRGMHYQAAPHAEAKLVRCTRGGVYDVIIDLRPNSTTYTQWRSVELTRSNRRLLYVPPGFAHGFMTLEADTELLYQISVSHRPESECCVRWNDPAFAITWPLNEPVIISDRDSSCPDFVSCGRWTRT